MKKLLSILLVLLPIFSSGKKVFNWDVPVDEKNKIVYSGQIYATDIDKETIFRRMKKFIAIQDFDKVENIKCKDKSLITTKFYEKAIRYEDEKDGIIIGSGYMPVLWRKFNYLWVVYDYKILAKDGFCKYEITDFKTINFFAAPKIKSRGSNWGSGGYGYIFGGGSAVSSMNSTKMQQLNLEEYITGKGEKDSYNMYFRENPDVFTVEMMNVIESLRTSVNSDF